MTEIEKPVTSEPESKVFWKSRAILGIGITAISLLAPQYAPIANAVPDVVEKVVPAIGLLLSLFGRLKAKKSITLTKGKK